MRTRRSETHRLSATIAGIALVLTAGLIVAAGCKSVPTDKGPAPAAHEVTRPGAGTYAIDPAHTFVLFEAQHLVVGRVHGRFDAASGAITVTDSPAACSVDVSIEAASLSTQNRIRDEDLRGPDFFAAAAFPVIEYHGRGIRKVRDNWVVDGTLAIRGITRVVPLSVAFRGMAPPAPGKPSRIAFHATAAVKRADFAMTRELLDEIGVVSRTPDVWIDIDAELLARATT